jgi:hypothetical protein
MTPFSFLRGAAFAGGSLNLDFIIGRLGGGALFQHDKLIEVV